LATKRDTAVWSEGYGRPAKSGLSRKLLESWRAPDGATEVATMVSIPVVVIF